MLKAIFYARFHPGRGPSIIHRYPENVETYLGDITSYIIPPYEVCGKALSICSNGYRVLGFPISLEDEKYERNRFTFNICFVLAEDGDHKVIEKIVSKTAAFFTSLEELDGLLQTEERLDDLKWVGDSGYPAKDIGVVYELLESIFVQLNTYGEACIRVSDLHVLNLRLVSHQLSPPPKVEAWVVPLLIRPLPTSDVWTWDLTLQRIHKHMDGVNHVQRISELADVELSLVTSAAGELVRLQRVTLLDLFHFQAVYILTEDFAFFVRDEDSQQECSSYVATAGEGTNFPPSPDSLITAYRHFGPGVSVRDLCLTHEAELAEIDIRRLVTYAVIKGFLRRVHKYVLAMNNQSNAATPSGSPNKPQSNVTLNVDGGEKARDDMVWKKAAFSSGWKTPPLETSQVQQAANRGTNKQWEQDQQDAALRGFLDGMHCTDEICIVLHMSEKKVLENIRRLTAGEYMLINK